MCDPLGKNLMLPTLFIEDFKRESFASSLGIFQCMRLTRKESSFPYWGYFWDESSASSLGICFDVLGSIGEEFSTSSMGMMLDMLELLRESLLLPLKG